MKASRISILILMIIALNCNIGNRKVTLYIVNNSRILKDVNIDVEIDTNLVVNQKFAYSGITPDYTTFIERYEKGIYSIRVKANNQVREDTFKLDKDIYVYISYDAALKENGDTSKGLAIYKTYVRHTQY